MSQYQHEVPISCNTTVYLSHTIVAERREPITSDHELNTEHLLPTVTHSMNTKSDTGGSLYIGGDEGGGRVYVSVHDATFDPSTGRNHISNILRVMRTSIGTNE